MGKVRQATWKPLVAWSLTGSVLVVLAAALVLLGLNASRLNASRLDAGQIGLYGLLSVGVLAYAGAGGLIARRVPGNAIGWLLSLAGLSLTVAMLTEQYALYGLATAPGTVTGSASGLPQNAALNGANGTNGTTPNGTFLVPEAIRNYDAVEFRTQGELGSFNFLASYTWSHAIDHVSGLNIGGELRPILPVVQGDDASIEAALAREKGDAFFDVRHRFVFSFGAELPRLSDKPAFVRAVAGGWQLNGIFQWQTGFPLTVTEGANLDIRFMSSRPDVVCDPNEGPKTSIQWFDTSCFVRRSLAETGVRPGNEGRNIVRGPGFNRTDLSLFKNVGLFRSHTLQLRVEAFNLFNQVRFGQPSGTIGTATFGTILSADDGRIIQLGVKYSF
jgi:hypothetical protein